MEDKTRHPLDERYIEAYAHTGPAAAGSAGAPAKVCPLCHGKLVSSQRRRNGYEYFRHQERTDDQGCPLTTASYQPPGMSVMHQPELVGIQHRARFLGHWQRHYRLIRAVAPMFTLARFTGLIEYADVLNLWSYERLDDSDMPYVLLVLAGFLSVRAQSGEVTRERYWFDGSVRDVGDLWHATRTAKPQLFRIVYRDPWHTPFPTSVDILHWESVEQVRRVADVDAPHVRRPEITAFERFIERHDAWRRTRGVRGGAR